MSCKHLLLAAGLSVSLAHAVSANTASNVQTLDVARIQAPNGEWFEVTKREVDGRKETIYRSGDLTLDHAQWLKYRTDYPAPKVDPAITLAVAKAAPDAMIPVAIWLADSPYEAIKADVEAAHKLEFAALDQRRERLYAREFAPNFATAEARESYLAAFNVVGDAANDPLRDVRRAIARDAEDLTARIRTEVNARLLPAVAASQAELDQKIKQLGGQVRAFTNIVNGASVFLPAPSINKLAADPTIANIVMNAPGEGELANQATSLGLSTGFWANGIDGGIWDGGQLDSGIQEDHPTFGVNGSVGALTFINGPGRGTTDSDGHGTAVASIIAGRNATNRGMAFGVDTHLNTSWGDVAATLDWMYNTSAQDPEVMNGSFGMPSDAPSVADYTATETYIDYIIRTQSALYTKSCGNLGPNANTLTQPAGIFNGLAVANMNDTNNTNRADDFINDSSSRGPTLGGRKKPDIAAPGSPTTAANNGWAGAGADWITFGGTSSASPHVAGGVLLLTDARSSDSPLPIKAILLNTADAWSTNGTITNAADDNPLASAGWNSVYGWGYLNLGAAYTNRLNAISSTIGGSPAFKLYKGNWPANGKATLVWNRFVTLSAGIYSAQNLTDLDLRLYDQAGGLSRDTSTATIDNVEQVFSATAEPVVLKVDAWSAIDPQIGATDAFALAHPGGFAEVTLPEPGSSLSPSAVSPGEPYTMRLFVFNTTGDVPLHNVSVNMTTVPAGWTISPSGAQAVGTVSPGLFGFGLVEYTVTPPCNLAGTSGNFQWTVSHNSYGESRTINNSQSITVEPIAVIGTGAAITDTAPVTYQFNVVANDFHAISAVPTTGTANINVRGDNNACMTSPWQDSTYNDRVDFVLVNGNQTGATTQYAHLYDAAGNAGSITIRHDNGFDMGSTHSFSFADDVPIYVIERSLNANVTYRMIADITSGNADIAVLGFNPSTTFAERTMANLNRDSAGAGADERFLFKPTQTGVHGFVIANDNRVASNVTFSVRCVADYNGNGVANIDDIFIFLNAWFASTPDTDTDLSGAINIDDIFIFLNIWFAGC
jgi:serine protease AprX